MNKKKKKISFGNWFKVGDNWYYYNGFNLDEKELSIKESYLLGLLFYNGITLSEKSHMEFHKIYGYRNNNESQLKEFLEVI